MFSQANLIQLPELFERWIIRPAIHWPLEALLDDIDESSPLQQSFTLFPGVEGLAPLHRQVVDSPTPGVVKVIFWD